MKQAIISVCVVAFVFGLIVFARAEQYVVYSYCGPNGHFLLD